MTKKTSVEINGKNFDDLSRRELELVSELIKNNWRGDIKNKPKLLTDKEFIYYRESFIQSFLSDLTSFTFLIGGFGVNQYFIHSKIVSAILLILFIMYLFAKSSGKSKTFTNLKDLKKYVNSIKE